MSTEPFILCEGLVKIYKVANLEVVALQGLDLVVGKGEMLGIVGVSGSGKTTLMNILGGLDRPSAGRVQVNGADLLKLSDSALTAYRRTKVGFVWQQGARNLVPYLTALENVQLPMLLSGQGWGDGGERALGLLEAVGLSERRHHRLMELSGGEQQRVAIAVALANHPSLLLADEPTGEVDSATAEGIFNLIRALNRDLGVTTLIVSHDPGIARYADRVIAIRDGKTSSETVRQAPKSKSADSDLPAGSEQERFEEVILLDSAGRLQVPREYLEKLGILSRVHLETVEGGILIRPAQPAQILHTPGTQPSEPPEPADGRNLRRWWKRLQRKNVRRA